MTEWQLRPGLVRDVGVHWLTTVFGDGAETLRRHLRDDSTDVGVSATLPLIYLPQTVKRLLARLLRPFGAFVSTIFGSFVALT